MIDGHGFLTDAWFTIVDEIIGPSRSEPPDLVVCYRSDEPVRTNGKVPRAHTQCFADGRLVEWLPGEHDAADLIIERPPELDRDDLLARCDPTVVAVRSRCLVPDLGAVATDLWGVGPGLQRDVVGLPPDLAIAVGLSAADTPFGDAGTVVEVLGPRFHASETVRTHADLSIAAPYEELLRWLHDPATLLGHLITSGATVEGDLFRMSAIEGIVSAPSPVSAGWEAQFVSTLTSYAAVRASTDVHALVDAVDEITT